jgi:hypothetical protein
MFSSRERLLDKTRFHVRQTDFSFNKVLTLIKGNCNNKHLTSPFWWYNIRMFKYGIIYVVLFVQDNFVLN